MRSVTLQKNPSLQGLARMVPDVIFSTATGTPLKAVMLEPWRGPDAAPRPALVFVQGSGWKFPDVNYEIPQLAEYARAGYVVLTITHRSRQDGHPFPAFLEDVKCAVRFLRANAQKYLVDAERIGIFGTSSGGNAALLTALTGDDPRYKTGEYASYSDRVQCMVECFGPTYMERMLPPKQDMSLVDELRGNRDAEAVMREMSPCLIAKAGVDYPPMLLLHGDADPVVPFEQCVMMYEKLQAIGADARMIRVQGAPHEGDFWSREVHRHILSFLDAHLL